jgi:4-alpha-glucanotransferase
LVESLRRQHLLAFGEFSFEDLRTAVHRYLGRTNALLALAQIEDVTGQRDPVNMPSSPDYPNWRCRIATTLEQLNAEGALSAVIADLTSERRAPIARGSALAR